MKPIAFLFAVPLAVLYIVVLGVALMFGLVVVGLRDWFKHLRQRQLVQCSWCGCLYQKGIGNRLWTSFGTSTGSHGICHRCFHKQMKTLNQNHQL